jgi:hypothetical protein
LEYCEMGCSRDCHLWGKQKVVWLAFIRNQCCFAYMHTSLACLRA